MKYQTRKIIVTLAFAAMTALITTSASATLIANIDIPISINLLPTCVWNSAAYNDPNTLSSIDKTQPTLGSINLVAQCSANTAYTVKTDADNKQLTVGGELITIAAFADAGRTIPMNATGISGATPMNMGSPNGLQNITLPIYFKMSGSGPTGGFTGTGGQVPPQTFTTTIYY
jgi:hypothetical protein